MITKLVFLNDQYYLLIPEQEPRTVSMSDIYIYLKSYSKKQPIMVGKACSDISQDALSNESKTMFVIDKSNNITASPEFMRRLFRHIPSEYITVSEYAELKGKNRSLVNRLCNEGRIPGVVRKGLQWLIPRDAPYPEDARFGKRVMPVEDD